MNMMRREMKYKIGRRFCGTTLAAVIGFTSIFAGNTDWISKYKILAVKEESTKVTESEDQVNASSYGLPDNVQDGAILHAFCWSFKTIKENMKSIAEAGYTTVQTSPANACNDSHPQMKLYDPNQGTNYDGANGCWWWHYQPTDWTIGNYQLGTKEDYAAMCEEADKYGVKIITDVIPNHTTPDLQRVSQNLVNAAGGNLYHSNGFNSIKNENESDWNWGNRLACTTGMMGGLPDVDTENQGFQEYYLKYCNDLISIGCDGFRYDTAKHIGVPSDPKDSSNTRGVNDFWDVATGKTAVNGIKLKDAERIFIYGEVLQGNNVPTQEYAKYMFQTASDFGGVIRSAIGSNDFSVGRISDWKHSNPDRIVSWVESHDTYCNHHESAWLNDWQIRACWAVITARKQGAPLFMSRPDGSNGSGGNYWGNNVLGAAGNDQYKHPEVAACNHFRNAMVGESEHLSNPNGSGSLLVIERGTKGAVIVNLGSSASNIKLQKVADGTYTEEVSGKQVQVSGGTLNYTVPGGSIAVVYNPGPVTKDPTVSVSKDSGTFTEAFDLTLTPSNATKATYSINAGDAVEFTSKKTIKIGEDCKIGDKVTVKVTATGEGEPFEKTFTYTMAEVPPVPEAKFLVRVKKSDFSTAPYIYAYEKGATAKEYAGEWPGTKLEDDGGDYYIFKTDDTDSATVILHDGGSWRNTQEGETEAVVTGKMEYDKSSNKFTEIKEVVKTDPPKTTKPAETTKPTDTPTQKPTKKPAETTKPTDTPTKKPTEKPVEGPGVTASLENGASFKTETQDVKLTFKDAKEVTYSVDGGPKKTVDATKNKDVTVTLGQGKIGNSEVTLEVESKNGSKSNKQTFKYKKEFVKSKGTAKALSVFAASVANKIKETAETVNGAPDSEHYATNPNGNVGVRKTIASASDFTEDMIIAQGVANDDPAAFKGTHEAPKFDQYAMYGAWDDENLYIGIQYTNVIDVVDPAQNAPQEDRGKPYSEDADIPQMLVFDTRSGDYTDGTANDVKQKTAWDINVKYSGDAKVDKVFAYSPKRNIVNQAFFPVNGGMVDYNNIVKTGYHYVNAEKGEKYEDYAIPGVSIQWEDGFFGSTMNGIKANGYEGYTPDDLSSSSAAWTDFLQTEHNTKYDTFSFITMPLSLLGVTASDIESNGIGVMAIATYGASGIGSLPADMTMLDCATEAFSQDDSTSQEKEDEDIVTVGLAQLGKSNGVVTTKKPSQTKAPATTEPSETKTPATTKPEETETPATKKPSETKTPATTKPTKTPETEKIYCVNFGADKSSPQYNTTKLTLKAEAFDGTEPYTYEFSVDGKVVQKASDSDSYTWKDAKAGEHTIKVVVKDKDGNETSSEKKYVIEEEKKDTEETAKPTEKPKETEAVKTAPPTKAPAATKPAKPTETPKVPAETTAPPTEKPDVEWEELEVSLTTNKKSSQTKGTKITIYAKVKGGSGEYSYSFMVENEAGKITTLAENSEKSSVTWTPSKAGSYKLLVIVEDKESGETESDIRTYKITNKKILKFNSLKASRKKVSARKKITLTASGTAGKGKVQYKFYYKKKGAKKTITIRKYSTKKKVTWKVPSKKGTYYVYCKIKDGSKKTLTKKVTIKVTKK